MQVVLFVSGFVKDPEPEGLGGSRQPGLTVCDSHDAVLSQASTYWYQPGVKAKGNAPPLYERRAATQPEHPHSGQENITSIPIAPV